MLDKTFAPHTVEARLYAFWEEQGFFSADPTSEKPPFCVMIPPPNVTGILHMGHALVDTLIDCKARFMRMKGYEVLWQPGTDHAGIATQTVVEKHLIATEGKRRKDYDRETFLKHVWDWKAKSESSIIGQLKKLGCSADWGRLKFTLDEDLSHAVRVMFAKMFHAGLIYRGDYLVNWDPVTQTALADDEVEHEEHESHLWYFTYPIDEGDSITIATTRPETMLGDTAVAVSPKDERYAHLIGKTITLPLIGRTIPIVGDHFVDPEFGTGAVKITPAHDPNDYEVALRADLPMINIMTPDGKINENGGAYQGLTMREARAKVVEDMKQAGFLAKIEPHTHRVGISYRSKAVIEPYLSKQWFVKLSAFKENLLDAVRKKKVELIPAYWEQTYTHWIENLRDWCISRQLWWGHRIPVFYHKHSEKMLVQETDELPVEVQANPDEWEQDEDVLDTWFSSALWPFSTLGWPNKTPELKKFYPNTTLMTGHDILFFWVARMIFMGEYALEDVPFTQTFLHGLIYGKSYWRTDADGSSTYVSPEEKKQYDLGEPIPKDVQSKWEKMSKSKGNVIDPLEIIDTYGTDAMRMALISSATHARQIDLDRRRFEEFKNFANKVWNGARFVFMNLTLTSEELAQGLQKDLFTLDDAWILSRLNKTITDINQAIDSYTFDKAATMAYEFFWNDFCAVYVESTKPFLFGKCGTEPQATNKRRLLAIILSNALRLLHPMAPFITEELFTHLKSHFTPATSNEPYTKAFFEALSADACIVAPFPEPNQSDISSQIEQEYNEISELIRTIRNIRAEMGVAPSTKSIVYISGEATPFLKTHELTITALVPIESIQYDTAPQTNLTSTATLTHCSVTIPLPQESIEKEKIRLEKEEVKTRQALEGITARLSNPQFASRAPKELVEKTTAQKQDLETKLQNITQSLATLR